MRVLVQKCFNSYVTVEDKIVSSIEAGLLILVGFTHDDTEKDIDYMVKKVIHLRIFEDENHVMNKSVLEEEKEILCISQFTLYGDTTKGNRPSYINAMKAEDATLMYDLFCQKLNEFVSTKKGVFGADMKVHLVNDGPTTIWIDSRK